MQIKIKISYQFVHEDDYYQEINNPAVIMASIGEDVEKLELLCIADRNFKWCIHLRKQYDSSSKN